MNIHIHAPVVTAKSITTKICPDCKRRTRMLSFFTPWYGWDSTCIKCGRNWSDGFGCRLILFGGVGSVLLTKQNGSGGHCRQLVKITMAYNASVTGASDSERPS